MQPPSGGLKFKPVPLKRNGIASAAVTFFDGSAGAREADLRVDAGPQPPADKFCSVGLRLQRECNFEGAMAMFRAALKQEPEHADAKYHLDSVLAMSENDKMARREKLETGRDSPPTPPGISPVMDFDALEAAEPKPDDDDDDDSEVIDVIEDDIAQMPEKRAGDEETTGGP
mmetsp:Transcript_64395/g.149803  ORF Transcript_64395/g.149803 Transcript_64395/m.149803 type:complete len:172 (+) Transcript_64395:62-577(+)